MIKPQKLIFILFPLIVAQLLVLGTLRGQSKAVKILIVYYSGTGNTEKMAMGVSEGAKRVTNVVVVTKKVSDVTKEDLVSADGIILGSPTYYANMAAPMKKFIDDWAFKYGTYFGDKVGGAFATGGDKTGGKEHVVISLLLAMMNNGMIIVGPLYEQEGTKYGVFGASAVTDRPKKGVNEDELDDARLLGERVATVAKRFRGGQ